MSDINNFSVFDMRLGANPEQARIVSSILTLLQSDPAWLLVLKKVLKRYPRHLERLPYPGPDEDYKEGQIIVNVPGSDISTARDIFNSLACTLDISTSFVSDADIVSSIVALEIWASVFYVDSWDEIISAAGIEGPDAVNALGAILSRAFGTSMPCMPFDPGFPDVNFESLILLRTVSSAKEFVKNTIGEHMWPQVSQCALSDLSYGALGGSRTHNAALLLALCINNID